MWKDYKAKRVDRKDINRRIEIGLSVYSKSPEAVQQAALNRLLQPAYAYTSAERKRA